MRNGLRKLQPRLATMTIRYATALAAVIFTTALLSRGELRAQDQAAATKLETAVASPASFLGHPVGADFKLPGWKEVSGYYRELAEASPNVLLERVGETTEGRDFLLAIISSPENLARLDEIKKLSRIVADPRGRSEADRQAVIERGKVIVCVTPAMHATEAAGTQLGMEFAWKLAASEEEPWRSARENTVVLIPPSLNPDGLDHVAEWYHKTVHTPHEDSSLLKLYQFYTGHDNNRDWFMLTQAETRHLSRLLYREWFPQFLWDVHQQGNREERFFVPPYRDPLNPNLDPAVVAATNLVGTRAILDMTREGFTGIATGVSYDNWWNGGNRSVPARHHMIGLLTEAASVNIASPIFQTRSDLRDPVGASRYQPSNLFLNPWPGGWWRIRDIIDYEMAFGRSLLGSINRQPELWLTNRMEAAERSIARGREGGPRAWIITTDNADRGAVHRLVDVLLETGVEIHRASAEFQADGRTYPAGSLVIWRDQPFGNYVKDLFELQDFPPGTNPYDVCGWTLPVLLGLRRVEVMHDFEVAEQQLVESPDDALDGFAGDPRLKNASEGTLSSRNSRSWTELIKRLEAGDRFRFVTRGDRAGLFVPASGESSANDGAGNEADNTEAAIPVERLPRIGVYSPWSGSMDEGWLRWVLDHFEIPFVTVRNETLRAGRLNDHIDVLILPDISGSQLDEGRSPGSVPDEYAGGLDPEGAISVEAFVRDGGKLIACSRSAAWAIDLFRLPLVDVTKGSSARGFSCPGSVLRGVVESSPLTSDLPHNVAVFFSRSSGWRPMTGSEAEKAGVREREMDTLLRYAPTRLLWSGYINEPEVLEGHSAWVHCEIGDGQVHLFGFRPHYRAWSHQAFHLLFRAVFLGE